MRCPAGSSAVFLLRNQSISKPAIPGHLPRLPRTQVLILSSDYGNRYITREPQGKGLNFASCHWPAWRSPDRFLPYPGRDVEKGEKTSTVMLCHCVHGDAAQCVCSWPVSLGRGHRTKSCDVCALGTGPYGPVFFYSYVGGSHHGCPQCENCTVLEARLMCMRACAPPAVTCTSAK